MISTEPHPRCKATRKIDGALRQCVRDSLHVDAEGHHWGIYVSADGCDAWEGTEARPLYSVEAAQKLAGRTGWHALRPSLLTIIVRGPGEYDGRTRRWTRDGVVVEPPSTVHLRAQAAWDDWTEDDRTTERAAVAQLAATTRQS